MKEGRGRERVEVAEKNDGIVGESEKRERVGERVRMYVSSPQFICRSFPASAQPCQATVCTKELLSPFLFFSFVDVLSFYRF